jgi:acetoin:2,6-dichlorophenolindophenol oxidoreductase subunit alpha
LNKNKIKNEEKLSFLQTMIRVRSFEKKVADLKMENKIAGPVHTCVGEEAVDVGVCSALRSEDYIVGNFRSHGHMISKGASIEMLMAELYGKKTGTNGGKGGSMHVSDRSIGSLGASAIVGSGLPIACGAAFASLFKKEKRITCSFFGDGASQEGVFYECLNLASTWKLPVLFVLINNGYAITTPLHHVSVSQDLYRKGEPFEIKTMQIDGQMVEKVYDSVVHARDHILSGKGPVLLEAKTSLFHPHQEGTHFAELADAGYRNRKDIDSWAQNKDPIKLYSALLISQNIITREEIDSFFMQEEKAVEQAVEYAESSPLPLASDAYENVFV